jgi:hypothetical protein
MTNKDLPVQVLVDGKEILKGGPRESTSVVDQDLTPDSVAIVQSGPIDEPMSLHVPVQPPVSAQIGKSEYENVAILGLTLSNFEIDSPNTVNASPAASSTLLRYQTFIPEQYVSAPSVGCSYSGDYDYYFAGDNRSFTPGSSKFRTRMDVKVDWATGQTPLLTKTVGTTHVYQLYNGVYSLKDQQTAPSSSMQILNASVSSSTATFEMKQDVVNPFCTANGIYFDFAVRINRSGGYSLTGSRLIIPDHEIYIMDSDASTWTSILQADHYWFFACLTPVLSVTCTQYGMNLTGSR